MVFQKASELLESQISSALDTLKMANQELQGIKKSANSAKGDFKHGETGRQRVSVDIL